jgi:hypothetical protein
MPPPGRPRPEAATYHAVAAWLENDIDRRGRPVPIRAGSPRSTASNWRHRNAIRDLFALDLDVKSLLPGDDTADGSFDNFADARFRPPT